VNLDAILHIYIAFDWGDEVDLELARRLMPGEPQALPRRPRTPPSLAYRPAPLRFPLADVGLDLPELGRVAASAEATLFDFAVVSLDLRVPFQVTAEAMPRLASGLADTAALVEAARASLKPLFERLEPAIARPVWSDLSEEYVVFQFSPAGAAAIGAEAGAPLETHVLQRREWLAALVRLEAEPLSAEEMAEALRLRLSYSPADVFIADWPAAVLFDQDCEDTLHVIEFANVQLLEFREIDRRLDDRMATAYGSIHPAAYRWLPFWRTHGRPLRALGALRVDAHSVFERTGNALKLVGDQYLARVYRLLAARFHLEEWERSIRHALEVLESVYQVLSDQAATYRAELLEIIVVLLILLEIVLAFVRH
jgi:hypothetical protein